jgi:hypothetical protein
VGQLARVAIESTSSGLTGDYLRVRLRGANREPGTLEWMTLSGTATDLKAGAGATGRAALPVLEAAAAP